MSAVLVRVLLPYLRYTVSVTFLTGPILMLLSTLTSVYKVQLWSFETSLKNPIHEGVLTLCEQIMLQMELSRLSSSNMITLGTSVVSTLYISYFVKSSGTNLSSCVPQFFITEVTVVTVPSLWLQGVLKLLTQLFKFKYDSDKILLTIYHIPNLTHFS